MHTRKKSGFIACTGIILLILTLPLVLEAQQIRKIEILNADETQYETTPASQKSRLLGNVRFKHEDILMNCDSAHYFPSTNTLDAFSRVYLWRADSLQLYGKFLRYNGNDRVATVKGKVLLIDKETRLNTEHIDYDLNKDEGLYRNGGEINNGDNVIKSEQGHYFAKENLAYFKDSVVVTNPDYIIYCDTLKYNTSTEIAYFAGPTEIISEDNLIYCENGWYDTRNNISRFSRNACLETEGRLLKGDSLYYERETGYGEALNNVELIDSAQNTILMGNLAVYYEKSGQAMLTNRALLIQIDRSDSLFVHADTLKLVEDTIPDLNLIKAYRHVKIFRHDIQGKCDSLVYADSDSSFRFFGEPVLWSEENQLTSEFITIYTTNKQLSKIEMKNTAFIVSEEDSGRYNQVKGRDMEGYFNNNELTRIDVNGNGETFYYARDGDEIIGVNMATSANLVIYLAERKIDRIMFLTSPDAKYQPLEKLNKADELLENFKWYGEYRPLSRDEIFTWKKQSGSISDLPLQTPEESERKLIKR